jgi:hypothetical protein
MLHIYHFIINKLNCLFFILVCVGLFLLSFTLYDFLKPQIILMHPLLAVLSSFILIILYIGFTLSAAKTVSDFVLYFTRNKRN